jgi:hypothetical protein
MRRRLSGIPFQVAKGASGVHRLTTFRIAVDPEGLRPLVDTKDQNTPG